ncbi:MAG: hypothetical protein E7504_04465 [Ruminococcus sp.]|nr:hypothetical protein [Ruminococcus sp.]
MMKVKRTTKKFKCVIAFVVALTVIASLSVPTGFAAKKKEVVNHVDDYTSLFPGLTDTKLKLSDPVFSDKDWYEYIEYVFYTEVQDGDVTYRIYQPEDYAKASIMAIGDYNPKEILGNTNNLSINLGELQGIFDMAAQGGSISKDFVGLDLAEGIAGNMSDIGEVMDNSKYYSNASFLGIPNDKKYTGVSNDGFFNADSLTIEIIESETVTACKTIAMNSAYSISESVQTGKESSVFSEVSDLRSNTHEESVYDESSLTSGLAISNATSNSTEISNSVSNTVGWEIIDTLTATAGVSNTTEIGSTIGFEESVGVDSTYVSSSQEASVSNSTEVYAEVSNAISVGASGSVTSETGASVAQTQENSISQNLENTNTLGASSADSSTIEHSLTSGKDEGVSYSHAKDISVDLGYGVDYQYGNEHSLSVGVSRTFNAREDEDVKNVGWKLCEYIVKIPYYIEAVKTDAAGEETVLYGQYVNYNLLNGVSRVFANGYIEHWYTGELVTYADFFEGFITATELVDMAKEQASSAVEKGGE